MKVGILIFTREIKDAPVVSYETKRLVEVGQERGHDLQVLFEPLFSFGPQGQIEYNGQPFDQFDIILTRAAIVDEPSLHTVTAEILKNAGYHIVNTMPTFSVSKNKLAQAMVFDREQIPHPRSIIVRHPKNAAAAADKIGYAVIIKVAFGTHGKGVFIAKDLETLQPIVDYLNIRDGNPVILQEYINQRGQGTPPIASDVRVLIVGDRVVAAMERIATGSDFRANGHLDAECRAIEITEQEGELALQTTKAFDLEIAGVDIIRSDRGPLVLEINSCPGFERLEKATSVDVACSIIKYLESIPVQQAQA